MAGTSSFSVDRVAQEPSRNRKPEPSEPFFPKPKAEPEPPVPFSRNRNRNQNCSFLSNCTEKHSNLLFLAFLGFLAFFLFKEFLAILSVFPFFPKDSRGSASRRNPCFFGGFPCCFPKRQGKEDQGRKPFCRGTARTENRNRLNRSIPKP